MQALGRYLLRVAAASLLVSLSSAVVPPGKFRKLVGFTGGLVLVLCIAGPAQELAGWDAASAIEDLLVRQTADFEAESADGILEQLITEKTRAYILDKAESLSMTLSVEVQLAWNDRLPYPWRLCLRGSGTQSQRQAMSRFLEQELAVPAERQVWQWNE